MNAATEKITFSAVCVHTPLLRSTWKQQRLASAASSVSALHKLRSKESVTKLWRWGGSIRAACCCSSLAFSKWVSLTTTLFSSLRGTESSSKAASDSLPRYYITLKRHSGFSFWSDLQCGRRLSGWIALICRITGEGVRVRAKMPWPRLVNVPNAGRSVLFVFVSR